MFLNLRAVICIMFFCFLTSTSLAETELHEKAKYNGGWWLSISSSEQSGFIAGYYDCYTYEFLGGDQYNVKSFDEYKMLMTGFYMKNSSKNNELVSDVLHTFRDKNNEIKSSKKMMTAERHGYFDGLYWMQINALGGVSSSIGFVEGYLMCHSLLAGSKSAVFSEKPSTYVAMITKWYGFKKDTGDINENRESTKIADVLFKFRDQ